MTNEKISKILKEHGGGKAFFDALDAMVRGDSEILEQFTSFLKSRVNPNTYSLILSGRFGRALMNNAGRELYEHFNEIVLLNGNLRSGEKPEGYINSFKDYKYIFADDSFYSGATRNAANTYIKSTCSLGGFAEPGIKQTVVIYDGSKERDNFVFSLFRYHE